MKYIELFKNGFDSTIDEKIKPENWPFVGYSPSEGLILSMIPEENQSGYQMIDLGLPSGLKWADRNVGASSPEDVGLYFQWGDTVGYTAEQIGKDKVFDWNSYFDINITDSGSTFNKYKTKGGFTTLQPEDDAAHANIGEDWRMPTKEEYQELVNNTTQTFIDVDGNEYSKEQAQNGAIESRKLKGVCFTGSTGDSIFMPSTGQCYNSTLASLNSLGSYWSSNLYVDGMAYHLYFTNTKILDGSSSTNRPTGYGVRGVQA